MSEQSSRRDTSEQFAQHAHEAVDRVAEEAGRAEERVRQAGAGADEKVREKAGHGKEQADRLLAAVGTYVRDNPMTAVGLAFAAGAFYASLRRR